MISQDIDYFGDKVWYKEVELHGDGDGDIQFVWFDGSKHRFKNGVLHRDGDLPAVEWPSGTKEWYKDGIVHRDGGLPAIEQADGTKKWYKAGKLHRVGGPAIMLNGTLNWYFEGHQVTEEQHNFIHRMHEKSRTTISRKVGTHRNNR